MPDPVSFVPLLRVVPAGVGKAQGTLGAGVLSVPCRLGRTGVTSTKREGDGATPLGRFPLRRVFYRPDRVAPPTTGLPVSPLDPTMGWCDDPNDPAYNRDIRLPHPARHEKLWRGDGLYDLVVVIGHNDAPVVPGAGSAIFLHVAPPDGRPTQGCVGLEAPDLRAVLALCGPGTCIDIAGGS